MKHVYQWLLNNLNTDYDLACITLRQIDAKLKALCIPESPNEELSEAAIHQVVDARMEIKAKLRLARAARKELMKALHVAMLQEAMRPQFSRS